MLSAPYRSPLNFSAELMEAAKAGLVRIKTAYENLEFLLKNAPEGDASKEDADRIAEYTKKFDDAMDDDLNTADAVSAVFELVKFINTTANESSTKGYLNALKTELLSLTDVLGLIIENKTEDLLDSDIEALINERQEARKHKNFARADEIRDELLKKGIILEDTRQGVKWKRAD